MQVPPDAASLLLLHQHESLSGLLQVDCQLERVERDCHLRCQVLKEARITRREVLAASRSRCQLADGNPLVDERGSRRPLVSLSLAGYDVTVGQQHFKAGQPERIREFNDNAVK